MIIEWFRQKNINITLIQVKYTHFPFLFFCLKLHTKEHGEGHKPPQPNNHTQRYESYLKINCNDVWQCFHVLILYISLIICVSYTKQYTMRNYNILHTIHYIYSLLTYIETVWYDGIFVVWNWLQKIYFWKF